MSSKPSRFDITGVVLAGGAGSRMGGVDKGLVELAGKPMAAWALEALAPQAAQLMINANRSLAEYRLLTGDVVSDAPRQNEPYAGPLAGILASMRAANGRWLLTLPCDAPFAPGDLAQRLGQALADDRADIAVVEAGGRLHPVHALLRTNLQDSLDAALAQGERKVMRWFDAQHCIRVNFDDQAEAFINVNTPEELATQAQRLARKKLT